MPFFTQKPMIEDSYRHRGLRQKLIEKLRQKGIVNEAVLSALGKVPRHAFFDGALLSHAYEDKAFPIGEGQTISQPFTVAFQSEKLKVSQGMRVLEIGTGSGYQACVLLELGAVVYTIEYNEKLFERTRNFLPELGYHPFFVLGDGSKGLRSKAPFDRILVTAGAPVVPTELKEQLSESGILVIPVGTLDKQKMLRITRKGSTFTTEEFDNFAFVPLLGKDGWEGSNKKS